MQSIRVIKLHGHIFFGSTLQIMDAIKRSVLVALPPSNMDVGASSKAPFDAYSSVASNISDLAGGTYEDHDLSKDSDGGETELMPTRYLILDMVRVTGLDATAARSVFLVLRQLCSQHDITLLFTGLESSVDRILVANGVLQAASKHDDDDDDEEEESLRMSTVAMATEHCEDRILALHSKAFTKSHLVVVSGETPREGINLARLLGMLGPENRAFNISDWERIYFERIELLGGDALYEPGQEADHLYIIDQGSMELRHMPHDIGREEEAEENALTREDGTVRQYRNGSVLGMNDFFMGGRRGNYLASANMGGSSLYSLSRKSFDMMRNREPAVAVAFQDAMIKHLCLTCSDNQPRYVGGRGL